MNEVDWLLPQTPVDDEDFLRLARSTRCHLPQDFLEWLKRYNGCIAQRSEILLPDGALPEVNAFLSFSGKDSSNVHDILKAYKDRMPDNLVPIADDCVGNYICLRYANDSSLPDVVLWMHEESDPGSAVIPIAPSFTDMVMSMARNKSV